MDEVQVSENNTVVFDSMSRTALISSKNGASKSISIGTYYFAISFLSLAFALELDLVIGLILPFGIF